MNLSSILVVLLLVVAGFFYVFQTKPGSDKQVSKSKEEAVTEKVVEEQPRPAPVKLAPQPVRAATPAPAQLEPPAPIYWYTARRVSVMTDTGVASVPAGVEVAKLSETEILFEGKRFTVKPGDLTTDVLVVADILSKQDRAQVLMEKERQTVVSAEQANVAAVQSHEEDKKAGRQAQITAAIASIDRQILALRTKIREARSDEVNAEIRGRSSGHGAVISKCEQSIAKLEAERYRLSKME